MKILLGMSGGLDSSCAAAKLIAEGHEVSGAVLRMHEYSPTAQAEEAAGFFGIPIYTVDCTEDFDRYVRTDFVDNYTHGKTPNPCVVCNRYVKLESLCRFAREHGFSAAATGHYCGIGSSGGRYYVGRAADVKKDQSYVLWGLTQEQLSFLVMPLAGETKEKLREYARTLGIPAAESAESQEICFIPDNDYVSYIKKTTGRSFPGGDFVDKDGKTVGRHRGIINYTVGQRRGLGLSMNAPVYVTEINGELNTVTVAYAGGEYADGVLLGGLNYQLMAPPAGEVGLSAQVKVRYSALPAAAQVKISGDEAEVRFDMPVKFAAPGQSAVAYKDGKILFGGVIKRVFNHC